MGRPRWAWPGSWASEAAGGGLVNGLVNGLARLCGTKAWAHGSPPGTGDPTWGWCPAQRASGY